MQLIDPSVALAYRLPYEVPAPRLEGRNDQPLSTSSIGLLDQLYRMSTRAVEGSRGQSRAVEGTEDTEGTEGYVQYLQRCCTAITTFSTSSTDDTR